LLNPLLPEVITGVTTSLYQRCSSNADFMPVVPQGQVHGFIMILDATWHSIRTWLARSFTILPLLSANFASHSP